MNKMKKLLSVVLAVVLALSALSMMGSAAKTAYKTVDELTALDAYSPYGQVTRLSLEERTSIVFDALDNLLPTLNINMGEVFNVLGLSVTIDLTSIDRLCYSLDTIKDTFENTLASIAMAIVDLGILESLETGKWTTGMSRDGTAQFTILSTLLAFLSDNTTLVGKVFTDGLDLGLVSLGDMSSIENIIMNLPGLVKGLVYPLIERWDDTLADIQTYDNSIADESISIETIANNRVKALFSDDMSITTLKYDVNGNMTSEHTNWKATATGSSAPGTPSATSPRCYYQFSSTTPGSVMTVYHIVDAKEAETLAKDNDDSNNVAAYNYFQEEQTYVMTEEVAGSGTYVWRATDEWNNQWSLKWYNDESPLLEGISGSDIDLISMSATDILYKFMPVLFEEMAPVVLNGSVKWALSKFVGAQWTYVGEVGSDDVSELADASNAFFTQEQGEYLWEWSDYQVINGTHYYRFEDQIWVGDISNTNNYFDIINWDYEVTADLFNKYVPGYNGNAAGTESNRLLQNTADFLTDVAELVLLPSAETADTRTDYTATWTRPTFAAGNANLVENVKALAQAVVGLAPQHIFGDDYATNERCYVELMLVENDNDTVLTGIAAQLVDMIMPSMTLPGKSAIATSGAKVGAILAAVVREFAAYLAPEYNFDALIYTSFENGTKTFVDPETAGLVTTGDTAADYWFDVILTMGVNVGYEYLRAFSDMGEDNAAVAGVLDYGYGADGKTYAANTTQATLYTEWTAMVDYLIDWALESEQEWCWAFENLFDCGLTVDLATRQDPFQKIENILGSFLPVDQILNVEPDDGQSKIEHFLRDDLILGIVNLNWAHLIDTISFPGDSTNNYFRGTNVLDQLASLLKNLINPIFAKVGGGSFALIPSAITDFDSLAKQDNLVTLVKSLVGVLYTAGVTQGGCRVLFPFLNFLLGWKTDPQKIADPVIWTSFRDGNDYAFQYNIAAGGAIDSAETKIVILNNSSGMLETHRNTDVTDHAYDINIRNITSDATLNTLTFTYDNVVSPYEQVEVAIGGTYNGEEAVTVTIEYDYVGKDGQAVGGTQYTSVSFLVSNLYEDSNLSTCQANDHDNDYTGLTDVKGYVFTEDLYTTATEYTAEIHYVSASLSNPDKSFVSCQPEGYTTDCSGNVTAAGMVPTAPASNYFAQYTGQAGGWTDTLSKDGTSSTRAKLYYALDGVTADTFKPTGTTDEEIARDSVYGAYDMGEIGVKYGSDTKVIIVDFIYYNDFNVYDIYTENKDNGYTAYDGVDSATWEAYRVAWNNIVKLATYPMMTTSRSTANWEGTTAQGTAENDYVSVIQPQIPSAIAAYEEAKEAYELALADAQASGTAGSDLPKSVQALADALATDVTDEAEGTKEINFQDYDFYEYFNYADLRTAHRNFVKTYYAPELLDQYYIMGSGIREEELDNVIAAEDNEFIAAGITASRMENTQEAIDAARLAHDEWKMPVNSDLLVDDMTARLLYYKQFVNDSVKENPDHMVFLNKEIAFVEAQNLVEADYTEASWATYADALAEAKKVSSGEDQYSTFNSRIYDVKYNLMVAYKNLLKVSDSLIEAGGTAAIMANRDTANEIFASLAAGDGAWAVKADVDADTAYAELISALGYYYVGEDGVTYNLYADSALEYIDNDRPNRQSNQAKVDTANANLEAAIANFEAAVTEPATLMVEEGFDKQGSRPYFSNEGLQQVILPHEIENRGIERCPDLFFSAT